MKKSYADLRAATDYDQLVAEMGEDFSEIADHRASNTVHTLRDVLMSGYAIFTLKYPSMLNFEQQTQRERENLKSLFGIHAICSDAQMRRVLDNVLPANLQSLFPKRFAKLKKLGVLTDYRFLKKYLLISVDGVHYFESGKVKCERCLTKQHQSGEVTYSHSMLSAALVHPRRREVFTLGGQAIELQDGETKNDCEINASKRLLSDFYDSYSDQPFVFVEDALYANEPHILDLQSRGWNYILNVKPGSHKALFKQFEGRQNRGQADQHIIKEEKASHHFSWMNNVPLNGQGNVRVNFLYYEEHLADGKIKRFSWVTSLPLRKSNVYEIMRGGRARWKIENEQFNTLKNQGYNFEHNYGHGKNNLCNVMAHLMLLAFMVDQMVQAFSRLFNLVWQAIKTKRRIWEMFRALYMTKRLKSFDHMLNLMAGFCAVQLE
jgi:hypothetical protein